MGLNNFEYHCPDPRRWEWRTGEGRRSRGDVVHLHQEFGGRGSLPPRLVSGAQLETTARNLAYEAIMSLDFDTGFCRTDIGWRELERERG